MSFVENNKMILAKEGLGIAQQALDNHARSLQTEFSSFKDFQNLFIDVFGDLHSSDTIASLQSQFVDGTLRPQVKFVSADTLTDADGNLRGAAFDNASQTILLADNLDEAGIASSIEQELGHWWDVQLNGAVDTTTAEGKAFDEGTAYAERFAEGVGGDNIFSDIVYQNDIRTIVVDGQEVNVEYRPIATWNIQGANYTLRTRSGEIITDENGNSVMRNTWEEVFRIMNNPSEGVGPIEVMAIQEAGNVSTALRDLVGENNVNIIDVVPGQEAVSQFDLDYLDETWRVYSLNNTSFLGGSAKNQAIVLRNPPADANIEASLVRNPTNPFNQRGILRVDINGTSYFSVHALADGGSDAEAILDEILPDGNNGFALGDFNRNIADLPNEEGTIQLGDFNPVGRIEDVYNNQRWQNALVPPDTTTQKARDLVPLSTLDYLFTESDLANLQGNVLDESDNALTPAFPSDHLPVVYDDGLRSDARPPIEPNDDINVEFFTPQNGDIESLEEVDSAGVEGQGPTYFIIHGLRGSADTPIEWQQEMATTLASQLSNGSSNGANVVVVTWDSPLFNSIQDQLSGEDSTRYEQAAADTEAVGERILNFIKDNDIDPGNTTLIGHSLGAQVAGWVGEKAKEDSDVGQISSIVGLDPARPSFETSVKDASSNIARIFGGDGFFPIGGFGTDYLSPEMLDADDAGRVVAIHTSPYYGYRNPIDKANNSGENQNALDIYINDGNSGTDASLFTPNGIAEAGLDFVSGTPSHNYAHEFFQSLLEGESYDQDVSDLDTERFSRIESIGRPAQFLGEDEDGTFRPLVSLNTVLTGDSNSLDGQASRGEINITRDRAIFPDNFSSLRFFGGRNIAGTSKDDFVDSSDDSSNIIGLGGNDTLRGGEGSDRIYGGDGDDLLDADNDGNDILVGGRGSDELTVGSVNFGDESTVKLIGVNPALENSGREEMDTLDGAIAGEEGAPIEFVLGDERTNYYLDDRTILTGDLPDFSANGGIFDVDASGDIIVEAEDLDNPNINLNEPDFAQITNFRSANDSIKLQSDSDARIKLFDIAKRKDEFSEPLPEGVPEEGIAIIDARNTKFRELTDVISEPDGRRTTLFTIDLIGVVTSIDGSGVGDDVSTEQFEIIKNGIVNGSGLDANQIAITGDIDNFGRDELV